MYLLIINSEPQSEQSERGEIEEKKQQQQQHEQQHILDFLRLFRAKMLLKNGDPRSPPPPHTHESTHIWSGIYVPPRVWKWGA